MKTCTTCQISFEVSPEEVAFLEKISPVYGTQKFPIPEPEKCPDCRLAQRTIQRNEQYLYNNNGKIALYHTDSPFRVVTHEEWWSENWDALAYGRNVDFSRNFFEQIQEINLQIPRVNLIQVSNENCPYTTGTAYSKNCYLINCSENDEDCFYGKLIQSCKDVMDSAYCYDSEFLYECFYVKNCYNCRYVYYSQNAYDCSFCDNVARSSNCFLCTGLTGKEYHFMNQPVSKEEYAIKVAEAMKDLTKTKAIFDEMRARRIYKYANIVSSENSTGDFLTNCKNCTESYDMNDSEDCKYVTVGVQVKDLIDCSNMYIKPELNYQVMGTIGTYNVIFSTYIFNSQNVAYSQFCYNSKDLFGCVGLRNKQYCILNKQYTKEEYETLVPKVIALMGSDFGKFFPAKHSAFAYNETVANDYVPLTREQALAQGYRWREKDMKEYQPAHGDRLACESCGKNYKPIPQEIARLKEFPVPSKCPDCRHMTRMRLRNPHKIYLRNCSKCKGPMNSTFAPERPETVYCEKCYLAELY
ncbi:hypothetical protein IPG41_03190 [Candidatus Peregrinibacteria bacterium]|nr:MAG: hypothetical protein IPG41_03190 [Candidatus Peregrinibacteria bacterium]